MRESGPGEEKSAERTDGSRVFVSERRIMKVTRGRKSRTARRGGEAGRGVREGAENSVITRGKK